MERMLRKKKDNSEYEIDRELTGKFAIEKNAEYQDRIEELEEENKNLKKEIIRLRKTVVMQEMERNDLFKRFAKVEAELEDYRIQEFNATMFKK